MKTLAYVIGGEARLVSQAFEQNEIYKQLCKEYDVSVYVHSWTQVFKWNKDNADYRWARTQGYYPPGSKNSYKTKDDIISEYSIYKPKAINVEEYNESYNDDDFPFGQYISRARGYRSIEQCDYVWLGRSDLVGQGPLPQLQEGKIFCPSVSFEESTNSYRAEDWYYAGPYDLFKNLLVWADDPINCMASLYNNPWIIELGDEKIRNTHVWQAILTGDQGKDIYVGDEIKWKLLNY